MKAMKVADINPGKYVLAVSGGVDSVVLLDILSQQPDLELVVAHFDHGIRSDSAQDVEFVKSLAQNYQVPFELGEGKLGAEASEAQARKARYDFLRQVQKDHQAQAIITAHHQDDVIETAILNVLRGTYRKGLSSLKSTAEIIRPLLQTSKSEILEYAKEHNLSWREDSTNTDYRYLRNYVRGVLIPNMQSQDNGWRQQVLTHINKAEELNRDIADALSVLTHDRLKSEANGIKLDRHWLIMLPSAIGREVLLEALQRIRPGEINSRQLNQALIFCKTAQKGKTMTVGGERELTIDGNSILVTG